MHSDVQWSTAKKRVAVPSPVSTEVASVPLVGSLRVDGAVVGLVPATAYGDVRLGLPMRA
jgi:hypothetical protein